MTIAIKVTNDDSRENAIVEVRTLCAGSGEISGGIKPVQLSGKQSQQFLVHSGQKLEIVEVKNG